MNEETSTMTELEEYLAHKLRVLGVSFENTKTILGTLYGEEEAQKDLAAWLMVYGHQNLTESQIIYAVHQALQ